MTEFTLDTRLANDTLRVGDLPLCQVRLMDDAHYPWLILVPRRPGIEEIYQLSEADQQQLLRESSRVARLLGELFSPDKLNIAAIGNMVRQLHVHHVVRYRDDASWPGPVWGAVPVQKRAAADSDALVSRLQKALGDDLVQ